MRRVISCFVGIVALSLFVVSCKEIVLPESGKMVSKVTYLINSITPVDEDTYDIQVEENSKAIIVPPNEGAAIRVSPIKPMRRGYIFQHWTDGTNEYQPGDLFTEKTVTGINGEVTLKAVFEVPSETDPSVLVPALDSKYWKESQAEMFTLTSEELASTGLRAHGSGRNLGSVLTDTATPITYSFVNLPGGYCWDAPNYTGNGNSSVSSPLYYHLQTVGLNEGPVGAIPVVEDFAIGDKEVPAGLFYVVKKWNDENNKGYILNLTDASNNEMRYSLAAGIIYSNSSYSDCYYDRYSAYDPLVGISGLQAMVFCNMLTEWYNDVKTTGDMEPLTFAYTKDGVTKTSDPSSTVVIKDVNSEALRSIGPRKVIGSLVSGTFSHVQGATGFRLPTVAEWMFAATVNPNNDTASYGTFKADLYKFPCMINQTYIPGSKVTTGTSTSPSSYNYINSSEVNGYNGSGNDYGTSIVAKKTPNGLGLYDICGNVRELTEGKNFYSCTYNPEAPPVPATIAYTATMGGSFNYTITGGRPSYVVTEQPTLISYDLGFRLCRTTDSYQVLY